jgi:hypothetical protein
MTKQGTATAWVLLACLCAGEAAFAQTPPAESALTLRALRIYRITTQRMLSVCSDAVAPRTSRVRPSAAPAGYRSCVSRAMEDSSARLDEAVRSMVDGDSVRALREYHAAFVRALAGIAPQTGESNGAYDERQGFLFHRLAHAWARFELSETVAQ